VAGTDHDVGLLLEPIAGLRERRVHYHDGRLHVVGQDVVELLGVLGEDLRRLQLAHERGAARR
jgi:hypothetical protein